MDELELLKKNWQKEDKQFPKLSYNEIYKMILKKSSSIVKWIFVISLLEFAFWIIIAFVIKFTNSREDFSGMESNAVYILINIILYTILAYFFYKFYINYKTINSTDNVTKLMENIIKTRRTVKHYVTFNLVSIVASVFIMLPILINSDPNTKSFLEKASANGNLFKVYARVIFSTLIGLVIIIAVLLLFYWLIYGILLKRLNSNYNELKKLEV